MTRVTVGLFVKLILSLMLLALLAAAQGASAGPASQPGAPAQQGAPPDPLDVALNHIRQNRAALGLTTDDLADMVVKDRYVSQHTGVTHIYLRQRLNGIEVFNGDINISISATGQVINVGSRFVPNLKAAVQGQKAVLSATEAVTAAANDLGLTPTKPLVERRSLGGADQAAVLSDGGISQDDIPVRLMYQPLDNGQVRLAWAMVLRLHNDLNWLDVRADAETGRTLAQNDWVANESYTVFPMPLEHPNDGSQSVVFNPADATASPFGWHDTNGVAGAEFTITRGNNVHAYTDTDADNNPDPGSEPNGGAGLNFNFTANLAAEPDTYRSAAVTNLFYWNNIIHDVFYRRGFNETAGNFQANNYGNGGSGGDYVLAEAQDGTSFNNANFATPPDGFKPRMQMFVWNLTTPKRDGDLDNGIIIHEYGHGISTRLTGGPSNSSCLGNQEQMGEGWSDFFALALTAAASDTATTRRGIGTYVLGQPVTGLGIRPAPYTTDMSVNGFTYGDIGSQAVPHGVGFVWASMLWEVYWNLVADHGFSTNFYGAHSSGGNNLALQLVVDGLKLQPCSPGFVDGRNAILAADTALTGGANQCAIWEGFAKRGLGYRASQGSANSTTDGTESFDLPPECLAADFTLQAAPAELAVCRPNSAPFNITVGQNAGFNQPVTLSAQGQPAGTSAGFNPNPVTPPGSSVLTIGNTGAAAAGSYPVKVVGQSASAVHTATVTLNLFSAAPSGVTLVAPANAVTGQSLAPTFSWSAATQGYSYTLQIAADAAFSNIVYSKTVSGTGHTPTSNLSPETDYYWRVQPANACGPGSASATFSFTTRAVPPLLLVDDDDNNPDVRGYYTTTLESLAVAYDIWDTGNSDSNEPDATTLSAYETVIWFSGDAFAYGNGPAGPGTAGEAALATYLNGGKCLFISSQDYHFDKGLTGFMSNYLGVSAVSDDVGQSSVTGAGAALNGLGPYSLSYPFGNYSDILTPTITAEIAFAGNQGTAALDKDRGYRTLFFGFPFEALPTPADREAVLSAILAWCSNAAPPQFQNVYLPIITKSDESSVIPNGDFEAGPTGWTEYSSNGWDLITTNLPAGATPRSGNWAAWLGGDSNEISYVAQQLTVPAGKPYLTYWHWINSEDICGWDFGGVVINGSVEDVYTLCNAVNTNGWVKHAVNLSAYAGQSVSLQIRAETDSSFNSNLLVDDVQFEASPLTGGKAAEPPAPSTRPVEAKPPAMRSGSQPEMPAGRLFAPTTAEKPPR
ncbi:MAG: hypothetical protein Kow0031_18800 [Anaerolineae bacterium]